MKITKKESIIRILITLFLIVVIVTISVITNKNQLAAEENLYDTIELFNGNNLDNWQGFIKDDSIAVDSTFFVNEGRIYISGQSFGYIRTREKYTNYRLLLDWRWPEEPGNSGVFLHVNNDEIWPVCIECQLKSGDAGDFVCFPEFEFNEHKDNENWVVKKADSTSEKLAGEWNTYDIRVDGDSVSVYVNGVLQNIASSTNFESGSIALQSEGSPVEFKNVMLIKKKGY